MAKGGSKRLEIREACAIDGEHQDIGDVIDVDDETAKELVALKRAVPAKEGAKLYSKALDEKPEKGKKPDAA